MEWQPARIVDVHPLDNEEDRVQPEILQDLKRKVVRVRLIADGANVPLSWRSSEKCDATKFYLIHPEDRVPGTGNILCEHEILTD